jgi:hypothetical protein
MQASTGVYLNYLHGTQSPLEANSRSAAKNSLPYLKQPAFKILQHCEHSDAHNLPDVVGTAGQQVNR